MTALLCGMLERRVKLMDKLRGFVRTVLDRLVFIRLPAVVKRAPVGA